MKHIITFIRFPFLFIAWALFMLMLGVTFVMVNLIVAFARLGGMARRNEDGEWVVAIHPNRFMGFAEMKVGGKKKDEDTKQS